MVKKGQGAWVEFLMTYGWVILVVLAAIGALLYFQLVPSGMCELEGTCACAVDDDVCIEEHLVAQATASCYALLNKRGEPSRRLVVDMDALSTASPMRVSLDGVPALSAYKSDLVNGSKVLYSASCSTPVSVCDRNCDSELTNGCFCWRVYLQTRLNGSEVMS